MKKLQHKFVEHIPAPLEDGILYVSIPFRVVLHKCCCGCGNEVALNLSPKGWQLTFDGQSVTLYPSIGNYSFKCQSHYWITNNIVEWVSKTSKGENPHPRQREESKNATVGSTRKANFFSSLFKRRNKT